MKKLNNYIQEKLYHQEIDEKLIVNNTIQNNYSYHPKTKDELIDCILDKIEKEGLGTKNKPLDLNDIDTSEIIDMSNLFDVDDGYLIELSKNGYFDISNWDVSNVINMEYMFWKANFNGDILNWDVSNVEDMIKMFAKSKFNGNISNWDVSNVKNMYEMFSESKFNGDISKWNVSNVENMRYMFYDCPLKNNPPKWYKE